MVRMALNAVVNHVTRGAFRIVDTTGYARVVLKEACRVRHLDAVASIAVGLALVAGEAGGSPGLRHEFAVGLTEALGVWHLNVVASTAPRRRVAWRA